MKVHISPRRIGLFMILIGIVLSVIGLFFSHHVVRFFELYFSPDQSITPNGQRELVSTYYFGVALLFALGMIFFNAQDRSWRARMQHVILTEPLCGDTLVQPSPHRVLVISSLVGLLLIAGMRLAYRFPSIYPVFYAKDQGLLDLCVPITIVISAALLGTAVWKLWKDPRVAKHHKLLSLVYLCIIGVLVVYAGEEISWGQDFFRWETPALFEGNIEDQTNLHNFFNPYFNFGYVALSLVLVAVILSAWLELNQIWLPFNRLFLPHPSLIGLSLQIAFVASVWFPEQELLEEMMAAFTLFYSLRIFTCFRSQQLSIEIRKQELSGLGGVAEVGAVRRRA